MLFVGSFAACGGAATSAVADSEMVTTLPEGVTTSTVANPFFDGQTTRLEVGTEILVVAVADEGGERSQGLMGVEDLGDLDGMLFVFESPRKVNFTMEDTLIALDLWFIDAERTIVETVEMVPCTASPCRLYSSTVEAALALETPLGRYDFEVGDHVSNDYSG